LAEDEILNSLADSSYNFNSSVSDSSCIDEMSSTSDNSDYTAVIIENQNTIIENQRLSISILGTILFLLIISIGIYLAFKFGKFIHNLIN